MKKPDEQVCGCGGRGKSSIVTLLPKLGAAIPPAEPEDRHALMTPEMLAAAAEPEAPRDAEARP